MIGLKAQIRCNIVITFYLWDKVIHTADMSIYRHSIYTKDFIISILLWGFQNNILDDHFMMQTFIYDIMERL